MKQKILISSHNPKYSSGFANVARNVGLQLIGAGHDVRFVDVIGANIVNPQYAFHIYNEHADYGNRGKYAFESAVKNFQPGIVLTIGDIWDHYYVPACRNTNPFYWISYIPVETAPIRPRVRVPIIDEIKDQIFDIGSYVDLPDQVVAYNEFGRQALSELSRRDIRIIQHGVDCSLFTPRDMRKSRLFPGMSEDTFLATTICRNNRRKALDLLICGWSIFVNALEEGRRAMLYLHVPNEADSASGWNLDDLCSQYGCAHTVLINRSISQETPISEAQLAEVLACSDVYLNTSKGEGFGLPIIEAISSGTSAVIVDYAGPSEIINTYREYDETTLGEIIFPIRVAQFMADDEGYARHAVIDTQSMAVELRNALNGDTNRDRNHAITEQLYSWDVIGQQWIDLIDSIPQSRAQSGVQLQT